MELRNRATHASTRQDNERAPLREVALGPTVYAGERYGKMSERLKRQRRNAPDVNATANRLITPRVIGVAIGLLFVFGVIFFLRYQTMQRRNRRKHE